MKQRSEVAADRAASYLREMGIRPSSKAYQYLLFALTQLQCGTPFQNSIWELTAIHFGQKRENVLACVRREIAHAFRMIGASGIRLSGGERQRIAIARAIIKDAPIIVLDEATAFSDPENEYLIQKAFEKLIQNKTVIMIAHRLSTIRNADQILVMEHGQLIEQGTHDTLMERQGKYTQMWNSYMESISWKIRAGKGGAIE